MGPSALSALFPGVGLLDRASWPSVPPDDPPTLGAGGAAVMRPEVLAPVLVFGGMALMVPVALAVWRLWFRHLYPDCTCAACCRRDDSGQS